VLSEHTAGVRLGPDFADTLAAHVARFNGFAREGVDHDFGRGGSPIEHVMHGAVAPDNRLPNGTMYPLSETGPYFATILAPGSIETKGGPKTNASGQILGAAEEPIPGLYGVGNCVASPSGQAYWSGGSTYGPYIAGGYAAARSAIEQQVRAV